MTVSSSPWDSLVSRAVLGTDRAGRNGSDLGDSEYTGAADDAPRALLDDLAHGAAYRRVARAFTAVEPAATAALPPPPAAALRRLREDHAALRPYLREWLAAAADAGYRLPARDLPLLARLVGGDAQARVPAARLAGPPGRHPALAVARPADPGDPPPELFRAGPAEQWAGYLSRLRAVAPERARALLESEWRRPWSADVRRVGARDRARLLWTLSVNLSVADEPFLEAVLGGRIKRAQVVAARLLAGLPGTAYAHRMARRALACVRPAPDGVSGFELTAPAALDESALRDQIGRGLRFPAVPGFMPREEYPGSRRWLADIIAATPLRVWEVEFALGPAELVARARESERLLSTCWVFAAMRQRNADWAPALAEGRPDAAALLGVAHPEDVARWVEQDGRLWPGFGVWHLLPGPWPEAAGRTALAAAARYMRYQFAQDQVDALARCLPVSLAGEVDGHFAGLRASSRAMDRLALILGALRYRAEMLDELKS